MNYQSISIRKNKMGRDKFLAELVEMPQSEMLDVVIDLYENLDQFDTQYDRANALTVIAIAWWLAGEMQTAKNMINQAFKTLTRANNRRDRLTFLVRQYLREDIPAHMVRKIFTMGGQVVNA